MAPLKKRKAGEPTGEVRLQELYSNEAMSGYRQIIKREIIQERGISNKPPFHSYIASHGWAAFCETPGDANISMASEFYANMRFIDELGDVLCRRQYVRIFPAIINEYYSLPSDAGLYKEYNNLKAEAGVDNEGQLMGKWSEIVTEVTQHEYSLQEILPHQNWGHIDKKYLTMEMNVWYSFITSRLLLVTINSEVQWERIRMLYALKRKMAIDFGTVIFNSMTSMIGTNLGLGFHSLITGLCRRAGCKDKMNDTLKSPMVILTFEAFKRRVKPQLKLAISDGAGNQKGVVDDGLHARFGRLKRDVQYMKSLCEHTAKILAYKFPKAVLTCGPYPAVPNDVPVTPISPTVAPNADVPCLLGILEHEENPDDVVHDDKTSE